MNEFVRVDLSYEVSYLNLSHVRSFSIRDSYQNGMPVKGLSMVVAELTFGSKTLYHGNRKECIAFVESLLKSTNDHISVIQD